LAAKFGLNIDAEKLAQNPSSYVGMYLNFEFIKKKATTSLTKFRIFIEYVPLYTQDDEGGNGDELQNDNELQSGNELQSENEQSDTQFDLESRIDESQSNELQHGSEHMEGEK